jgi:hypothetical protein
MLRAMYRALLLLRPREWRAEMLTVFDQASAGARVRGRWAYLGFGLREVGGLLHVEPGGLWRWAGGGLLLGLLTAWVFTLASPEVYTCRALVRARPSPIPTRFVPATPALTVEGLRTSTVPAIFSRLTLTNIIQTFDLYRSERSRMPMEDVVELMRERIEIRVTTEQTVRIGFSYQDRFLAQKVTRDILTRLIDETLRERASLSHATVRFLENQADRAATKWDELDARIHKAGQQSERLLLDRDLARRHYETLRQQVSEAEMIAEMDERRQGPSLEILDLPFLPERPEISHQAILLGGACGGLLLGWCAGWLRRLRFHAVALEAATLH